MNIALDPKILEAIQTLAQKLGTTAEYLFGVMKAQVYAFAWADVFGAILGLTATVLCGLAIRCVYRKSQKKDDYRFDPDVYYGLAGVFGLVSLSLSIIFLVDMGLFFINPNYYALKLLFETLSKLK